MQQSTKTSTINAINREKRRLIFLFSLSDFPRDTEVGVVFAPISDSHTGDENGMRGLLNISETQTITFLRLKQ